MIYRRGHKMIVEFAEAALPWVLLALFVAFSCRFGYNKEK